MCLQLESGCGPPRLVLALTIDLLLQLLSKQLGPSIQAKIDAGSLGVTHSLVNGRQYRPILLKSHSCPVVQ